MATDHTAPALHLVQPRRPLTNAERQKAWRERQKAKTLAALPAPQMEPEKLTRVQKPRPAPVIDVTSVTPVTAPPQKWTKRPFEMSTFVLRLASVALAGVGLAMNATYAHSLGSSDLSGWLFLALGVAADSAALVLPSVAATAADRIQRLAGWSAFAAVFTFAILASVGFASTSISDVTSLRSSRVTPTVTAAQAALADAQSARDRECRGGVGKFCRERETVVASARQNLEQAMHAVEQTADPQTAALVRMVAWSTHGTITPSEADIGMIRLILFALLPQIGGILLMVSRRT